MLVPFRAYQPFRLSTSTPASMTVESLLAQAVLGARLQIQNRSSFAAVDIILQEVTNLGLSADPMLTGQILVTRLQMRLQPGQTIWHSFGVPFLEPYGTQGSNIPTIYHTVQLTNAAVSPTLDDIVGIGLFAIYEDVQPALIRNPVVVG